MINSPISASQEKQVNVPLPSLKDTILRPKNLIVITLISIVLNIIFLISLIVTAGSNTPSPTPVVTGAATNVTPTITPKASPKPTLSPEENSNELLNCFNNCDPGELLSKTREVGLKITNFKSSSTYTNYTEKNCYGTHLQGDSPDKEFNSYYPIICENNYISKPPKTTIQIGDNLYILNSSGNWNLDSKPRFGHPKPIRVIDEAIKQQTKTFSESDEDAKVVTALSRTINELSQEVTKTVVIKVNSSLEIISYTITTEKISREEGYFYGIGEINNISNPL